MVFLFREIGFKFSYITDPPNMIANPVMFFICPYHFSIRKFFTDIESLKYWTIGIPWTTFIIDFTYTRFKIELPEHIDKVMTMNVIPDLFSFVSKNSVWISVHNAFGEVSQEAVQFSARMCCSSQTTSPEDASFIPKYLPYSWTNTSAATLDAPNRLCFNWSMLIASSIPNSA